MINKALSPTFLLPFLLVSPMLALGPYGLSLAEIMTLIGGVWFLLFGRAEITLARGVVIYLLLYATGWALALYNGTLWGINVGPERLSFLYSLGVPLLAYVVGRTSAVDIYTVVTSKATKRLIAALAIFAAAYPFIDFELRQAVLRFFWLDIDTPRLLSPRFPGLGINANVYSFLVFLLFVFSLSAYFRKIGTALVPLCCAMIIIAGASKTVSLLVVAAAIALWAVNRRPRAERRRARCTTPFVFKRRTIYAFVAFAVAIGLATRFFDELLALSDAYVLFTRVADIASEDETAASGIGMRQYAWGIGLERVMLAPFLGIAVVPATLTTDELTLFFSTPHNEFIFLWTAYGLLGLLAHIWLLGYLLRRNLFAGADVTWLIIYLALVLQMFFDSAFQAPRFLAMFFMLVGLNFQQIHARRRLAADSSACLPQTAAARGQVS